MKSKRFEILKDALDDDQIFFTLSNWAGGIKLIIDDPIYIRAPAEGKLPSSFTEQEIVAWLDKTARELYPDSGYSKSRLAEAAYEEVTAFDKE